VFGGDVTDTSSIISGFRKNDVWRYRPSTNNWTWVSGSDTALPIGINNGYCKQDKNIEPQDRFENLTVTASDCNRTSWLFGGYSQLYALNDLWSFNTENYEWTLVKGNPDSTDYNQNFGIQGIESISNEISARGGSAIWSDREHNIWIFGGVAYFKDSLQNILPQERNDLWRFKPDYTCLNVVLANGDPFQPPLDSVICQGEITKSRLNGNYITSILPGTGFNINEDSSEISFFPSTTTTYTVVSSNPCSNQNVTVFTIIVLPSPVANFSFGKPSYEIEDGIITFNNQSQNAASYEWYYNNQLISVLPNPAFPIDSIKEYCFTLIVKNTEGCSDTSVNCVLVKYFPPDDIFIPNAFSPNEDGINDAFGVTGNNILNFHLYIFNRFGEQVAHLTTPKEKWNGYYKGKPCDMGSYYYVLNYRNSRGVSKLLKGDISLIF
jgi:gliding motility-associated-like protein